MTPLLCGKCQRAFLTSDPKSQFRDNPSYMFLSAPMWRAPCLTFASWKHILVLFIRPYPNISLSVKPSKVPKQKKNEENETILKKKCFFLEMKSNIHKLRLFKQAQSLHVQNFVPRELLQVLQPGVIGSGNLHLGLLSFSYFYRPLCQSLILKDSCDCLYFFFFLLSIMIGIIMIIVVMMMMMMVVVY